MHRGKCLYCYALHKNYYNYCAGLDSENGIGYNNLTILFGDAGYVSNSRIGNAENTQVTTIYNGKREVWTDYEQAKAFFLEMMMTAEGEERERAECVYIQLLHGLDECSDEDE